MPFIETDCVFEHEGKSFESGGAIVTPDRIIAYLGKDGILTDWHGNKIGHYRITATWKLPRSCWISSTMSQVEATVEGIVYTGRSCGEGMIYKGRRKAN